MDPVQRRRLLEQMLPWMTIVGLLVVLGSFLCPLPNVIALDDGIRHYSMGRLMTEKGILGTDGWREFMYSGSFSATGVDPWFLADALYVPLAPFGPVAAVKLYALASIACLLLSFRLLLAALEVPPRFQALMMVFLLFGDSLFFMRQLLGRPFTLLTALCLLVVWAVLRRRWFVLLVLLALATLLSQLFIFPLFIAGVGSVWLWRSKRTSSVLCAGASVAGTSAGLALHPQPLEYLRYLAMGFFGTLVPFSGSGVDGSEVHSGFSKNALHVILGIGIVCVLLLPILLRPQTSKERVATLLTSELSLLFPLVAVFFLAFVAKSRTIDLLWPLLLASIARTIVLFPRAPSAAAALFLPTQWPARRCAMFLLLVALLESAVMAYTVVRANRSNSLDAFSCIRALPDGMRVFNVDWDLIPPLIAVNPRVRYATGMDPAFTDTAAAPRVYEFLRSWKAKDIDAIDVDAWAEDVMRAVPSDLLLFRNKKTRANFFWHLGRIPSLSLLCADSKTVFFSVRDPK